MIGLWALSSTCHAQQWAVYPANDGNGKSIDYSPENANQYPEDRIIRKTFEVTTQWQTITFEKPLHINQKGLMGLHLAVDKQLYIPTMYDRPLNPGSDKSKRTANAFYLRRSSDRALIKPEVILIAVNDAEVKVRPAGHLYPFFDKDVITMALRTCKNAKSLPPPFPKGIKAFKAMRIRSTEPFMVKYLYWNVDRHPFYK